jgi:hypothetical protein
MKFTETITSPDGIVNVERLSQNRDRATVRQNGAAARIVQIVRHRGEPTIWSCDACGRGRFDVCAHTVAATRAARLADDRIRAQTRQEDR